MDLSWGVHAGLFVYVQNRNTFISLNSRLLEVAENGVKTATNFDVILREAGIWKSAKRVF